MTQIGREIKRRIIKSPKRIGVPFNIPIKAPPEWLPAKEPVSVPVEVPVRRNADAN